MNNKTEKEITVCFSKGCIQYHDIVDHAFLENKHLFWYDTNTTFASFLRGVFAASGLYFREDSIYPIDEKEAYITVHNGEIDITDKMLLKLFLIKRGEDYIEIWDTSAMVCKLLEFLQISDGIELFFKSEFELYGEGVFNEVKCEPLRFFFNSDEAKHWGRPHVHASYGGKTISIDLNSFEVIVGDLENKKYQKMAIEKVKNNQRTFLKGWNEHTNGLSVNLISYSDMEMKDNDTIQKTDQIRLGYSQVPN